MGKRCWCPSREQSSAQIIELQAVVLPQVVQNRWLRFVVRGWSNLEVALSLVWFQNNLDGGKAALTGLQRNQDVGCGEGCTGQGKRSLVIERQLDNT